jgi:15-cis-phytoene synthase
VTQDEALQASYRFCSRVARREAKNFYHAFWLLPPAQRRSMCALYAFLRHTDDLADEPGSAALKTQALGAWRVHLDAALAGENPAWPGFLALADTVARHGIPVELLHEVITGVSRDIGALHFGTFDDLAEYCYQVASVVGLCCLHIWGYRSEGGRAEKLAEECGIALQLTNILRDIGGDAREGRIYLPADELERFGVVPGDLAVAQEPNERLRSLLAFQAQRAGEYYQSARQLAPLVARIGRPVLLYIVGVYRALLDEIMRRDFNVLSTRISVSPWRKLGIGIRALLGQFADRDLPMAMPPEVESVSNPAASPP